MMQRNGQLGFTSHYAGNYGMPYYYIANNSNASIAFSAAPDPIIAALGRLIWAAKQTVPATEFQTPNEMLFVAYMYENLMSFHSDGEKGLGDTIMSLSLGCDAEMNFRMQDKYFNPKVFSRPITEYDPKRNVPVGSKMWAERKRLNELYGQLSKQDWERMRQGLYDAMKKERQEHGEKVLKLLLKHGDYVVMHGNGVQKYYEVSHRPLSLPFSRSILATERSYVPSHADIKFSLPLKSPQDTPAPNLEGAR